MIGSLFLSSRHQHDHEVEADTEFVPAPLPSLDTERHEVQERLARIEQRLRYLEERWELAQRQEDGGNHELSP